MPRSEKQKKAFTLVEVLIGLATFGLVMTAVVGILYNIQWGWQRQRDDMICVDNARWAMEFMGTELKQAGNITTPASDRAKFDLDTDGDNAADTTVWYWRGNSSADGTGLGDSTYLYRGIGSGIGQAVAVRQQLANFVINNPSGNNIFDQSSGLVTIELTTSKGTRSYTARTMVRPRN
ncbi:MAG: type II secretion system protein [Candidatus Omnitrophica bacterium]|nr:type II secretion system protein [Candidatus Omnitrophota bacterium]